MNQHHDCDLSYIVPHHTDSLAANNPTTSVSSVSNTKSLNSWSPVMSMYMTSSCGLETKHNYPNMDPNG